MPKGLPIDDFRSRYCLRPPERSPLPWENRRLTAADGFRLLGRAPARAIRLGTLPSSRDEQGANRYLWVIDANGIPYVREAPIQSIGGNVPKHTNLTGGRRAYLGGELWFASHSRLYVSGGSGRYPPVDRAQLDCAFRVFRDFDYDVVSLGWDEGTDTARRYLEQAA